MGKSTSKAVRSRMIQAVLIFNNQGKPRLSKFYTPLPPSAQSLLRTRIFSLVSDRPAALCNFLDAPGLVLPGGNHAAAGRRKGGAASASKWREEDEEDDLRVIYRHYATLYFVFVVDGAESELGILDLIQVFVESLDRSFENVCELDLIFHFDEVIHILGEVIQGGLVLETNINLIAERVKQSSNQRRQSLQSPNPLLPSSLNTLANSLSSTGGTGSGGIGAGGRSGSRGGAGDAVRNVAGRWLQGLGVGV